MQVVESTPTLHSLGAGCREFKSLHPDHNISHLRGFRWLAPKVKQSKKPLKSQFKVKKYAKIIQIKDHPYLTSGLQLK